MKVINYITNLQLKSQSGGWDGINYRIYNELIKHVDVNLSEGINPKPNSIEKVISKFFRMIGRRGNFFFFSEKRLAEIADLVEERIKTGTGVDFYFGVTPWIYCFLQRPYATYLDASFKTYLEIYSAPEKFSRTDVQRICNEEAKWLNKAKWIFWGSNWALNEAASQYGFDRSDKKHLVINTGGNIPIPNEINPTDFQSLKLLFISLNFEKKGGFVCFESFKLLQQQFPTIELNIVGERPPDDVVAHQGVNYIGFLNKNNPQQLNALVQQFESATFLVHPTKMDTMGAVIIEAGYYGCPTIAPRMFGIPDLIVDGETGYLIDDVKSEIIAGIITKSILNKQKYQAMRESCFKFYSSNFSWEAIGNKMIKHLLS